MSTDRVHMRKKVDSETYPFCLSPSPLVPWRQLGRLGLTCPSGTVNAVRGVWVKYIETAPGVLGTLGALSRNLLS